MKKLLLVLAIMAMFVSTAFAGEKTLQFTWDQNISSDFAGWKIYKSEIVGGPYTYLVDVIYEVGQTDFTSAQVIVAPDDATTTFYFVLTSLDTSGNESGYSGKASITIDFEPPDAPFSLTITVVTD